MIALTFLGILFTFVAITSISPVFIFFIFSIILVAYTILIDMWGKKWQKNIL